MRKNISILIILTLLFLVVSLSSVCANENVTDDIVSIEENTVLSVDSSDNLEIDYPDEPVEQTFGNDSVIAYSNDEFLSSDSSSDVLGATNVYVTSVTAKWGADKYVYLGWDGYLSGSFKVYKGSSCVHSESLSGSNGDREWSTSYLDVGTYTAKLFDSNGKLFDSGKIKIQKSAVKVSVKSFKANSGTTFYCYAYVTDKYDDANYNGGYVYFKINGKTYKAKLNDGVAILKFKIPSKAKTYTCKAIYKGDSQFKGATKIFKMTVKKVKYKTVTKKITYKWKTAKVGKYKIHYRLWKVRYAYGYLNYVDIELLKNGKQVNPSKYISTYHTKVNGKWKWMKWRYGGEDHAYHRYITVCKVDKIKIKFRV